MFQTIRELMYLGLTDCDSWAESHPLIKMTKQLRKTVSTLIPSEVGSPEINPKTILANKMFGFTVLKNNGHSEV